MLKNIFIIALQKDWKTKSSLTESMKYTHNLKWIVQFNILTAELIISIASHYYYYHIKNSFFSIAIFIAFDFNWMIYEYYRREVNQREIFAYFPHYLLGSSKFAFHIQICLLWIINNFGSTEALNCKTFRWHKSVELYIPQAWNWKTLISKAILHRRKQETNFKR